MQGSEAALVRALFAPAAGGAEAAGASPNRSGGKRGKGGKGGKGEASHTVSTQFIAQLGALMRTINSTEVQYVRCIKVRAGCLLLLLLLLLCRVPSLPACPGDYLPSLPPAR
jgi:hypothetical protein